MTSALPPRIRCRQVRDTDTEAIVDLLTGGLPGRPRRYFVRALASLAEHATPPGFPKYGYLLESDGTPVGAILLIYSSLSIDGEMTIRCNVSSWYVEPAFRSHAPMLVSQALKHKHVTYFNISPAPHTIPILEAQGYVRYCSGRFMATPAFSARSSRARVRRVAPDIRPDEDLPSPELELLLAHARFGCMSLICRSKHGGHPFVFRLGRFRLVPYAYLVYCRGLDDFVRCAGPVGRFLSWRGYPLVFLDSNGPIRGLIGAYSATHPKYFKGPHQPRLGDLAYSELAMFG